MVLHPQISVVIPLFNKVHEASRSIESVLNQTYSNFEILIINDGSTDGSEKVAAEYAEKDSRIHLITQKNSGVSVARNTGINAAAGELIAFLDADDEWMPEYLETIIKLNQKYPEAGIYAAAYYQRYAGTDKKEILIIGRNLGKEEMCTIPSYFETISLGPQPIMTSGITVPKKILSEIGKFTPKMLLGEDLLLWAKIALHYPVAYSSKPLAACWLNTENNHKASTKKSLSERIPFEEYVVAQKASGVSFYESEDNISLYLSYLRIIQAHEFAYANEKKKALKMLKMATHRRILPKKVGCFLYIVLPEKVFRLVLKVTGKFTKIGQTL